MYDCDQRLNCPVYIEQRRAIWFSTDFLFLSEKIDFPFQVPETASQVKIPGDYFVLQIFIGFLINVDW